MKKAENLRPNPAPDDSVNEAMEHLTNWTKHYHLQIDEWSENPPNDVQLLHSLHQQLLESDIVQEVAEILTADPIAKRKGKVSSALPTANSTANEKDNIPSALSSSVSSSSGEELLKELYVRTDAPTNDTITSLINKIEDQLEDMEHNALSAAEDLSQ
ncbi:hypothetical protein FE257_007726 [Aspergillus nanangensis]|uniref:Uncharacterized protein n=1 Tax=Aspergillus nanangensis TaxID=2582783 RepID=A0AAD4GXV2_ASPNN|nr:hypothetical protein FE257_007726 [Aspergillus nanangensis]